MRILKNKFKTDNHWEQMSEKEFEMKSWKHIKNCFVKFSWYEEEIIKQLHDVMLNDYNRWTPSWIYLMGLLVVWKDVEECWSALVDYKIFPHQMQVFISAWLRLCVDLAPGNSVLLLSLTLSGKVYCQCTFWWGIFLDLQTYCECSNCVRQDSSCYYSLANI